MMALRKPLSHDLTIRLSALDRLPIISFEKSRQYSGNHCLPYAGPDSRYKNSIHRYSKSSFRSSSRLKAWRQMRSFSFPQRTVGLIKGLASKPRSLNLFESVFTELFPG